MNRWMAQEWTAEAYGKVAAALLLAVAVGRAATAAPPPEGKPATEAIAREAYRDIVSRERTMRHDAALKFPGDPWSQDDDFHSREEGEARSFAASHDVRLADVLRAVDDGMRAHWSAPVTPDPRVPPCRPRLAY
ncbi:MAG TPA: hypothetical protein VLM85_24085 [Polyangiaceae bacterium]|nr:hypothetical protein [Polyangiaceae bacterium]